VLMENPMGDSPATAPLGERWEFSAYTIALCDEVRSTNLKLEIHSLAYNCTYTLGFGHV